MTKQLQNSRFSHIYSLFTNMLSSIQRTQYDVFTLSREAVRSRMMTLIPDICYIVLKLSMSVHSHTTLITRLTIIGTINNDGSNQSYDWSLGSGSVQASVILNVPHVNCSSTNSLDVQVKYVIQTDICIKFY